jgi:hypothetical protein
MRMTLFTVVGCFVTVVSSCYCQTPLTAADAQALQSNTAIPSTHLVRALAAQAQSSLTKQYASSFVAPSAQEGSDAYHQLANQYQTTKQNNDVGSSILKTTDYVVKTAIVGGLSYSGVGAFAAPIAGVVSDLSLGEMETKFTDSGRDELQRILKTGLDQVKQTNQPEYDRLTQMTDPSQFIDALDKDVNGLFGNSLDNISQEDKEIVNSFRIQETGEIMKDGFAWVANTASLQQGEIDGVRSNVINIAKTFDQFSAKMGSRVDDLVSKEDSLEDSVTTLQNDFGGQQDQITYLQTAMFGTMSPDQRKAAISNGMLDNLPPEQQKALEEENDIELKNQAFQVSVSDTLKGADDLLNIAGNIGVSPQLVSDAKTGLEIAEEAANAFADFSSGNILGGISSISNVFGLGGPDVEAIRQQQVMQGLGILEQGQSIIMQKETSLIQGEKTIIQNQQHEMDALSTLSKQLQISHQAEMDELQRIDVDVLYNRKQITDAATKNYFDCQAIVDGPNGGASYTSKYIDTAHQLYPSEQTFITLYNSSKLHFTNCLAFLQGFRSEDGRFDPVLFNLESYKPKDPNGVENFISLVYTPAFSLLSDKRIHANSTDTNNTRMSSLFVPVTTVDGFLAKQGHILQPYSFQYQVSASDYLTVPFSVEQILETARIVEDAHFYFMLVDANDNIRPWHELVSAADVRTTGYLYVLPDTLELLDIGIAQQQLISGDSLLPVIDEVLSKWNESFSDAQLLGCTTSLANMPEACNTKYSMFSRQLLSEGIVEADRSAIYNRATSLLDADSILAHNFLLYKLRQQLASTGTSIVSYSLALGLGKSDVLKSCIDADWQFVRSADGNWSVQFGSKPIPLPSASEVASGNFLQRAEIQQLLTERERITDELATYNSINIANANTRKTVNTLLMMSIQKVY